MLSVDAAASATSTTAATRVELPREPAASVVYGTITPEQSNLRSYSPQNTASFRETQEIARTAQRLKTMLRYAALKVDRGWTSLSFEEVQRLADRQRSRRSTMSLNSVSHISPPSTTTAADPSPPLANGKTGDTKDVQHRINLSSLLADTRPHVEQTLVGNNGIVEHGRLRRPSTGLPTDAEAQAAHSILALATSPSARTLSPQTSTSSYTTSSKC